MAAATATLNQSIERDKRAFDEVKWICDRVGELASDRNAATHAPLTSTPRDSMVFPYASWGNPLARKLERFDVLAEYRRLRDTAVLLRDYCGRLEQALSRDRPSWPDRPQLPERRSPGSVGLLSGRPAP